MINQSVDSYTLVIVDMQPSFKASKAVVSNVEQEVRSAVEAGNPIVVLQYKSRGRTHRSIMDLLDKLKAKYSVEWKSRDDGSAEVEKICRSKAYNKRRFRVCGVNTHACVRKTVVGLTKRYPAAKVELATEACNGPVANNWKRFPRHRNIELKAAA